jgi:hypothetical protein
MPHETPNSAREHIIFDPVPHNFSPFGVNPNTGQDFTVLSQYFQGDLIELEFDARTRSGEIATPSNSKLLFTLTDMRFKTMPLFTADWGEYIKEINNIGGVQVTLPQELTATLRRGSFLYSLTVTDKLKNQRCTCGRGNFLIEYGADAPLPDIPYRPLTNDPEDETQNDGP